MFANPTPSGGKAATLPVHLPELGSGTFRRKIKDIMHRRGQKGKSGMGM
jgi:hypothetical protein